MRGGPGARVGVRDERAQRQANADAPRIRGLWRRIGGLFRPYRALIAVAIALVLVTAGISVLPPLLTQRAFDEGLFPVDGGGPNLPALWKIVLVMAGLFIASSALGIWQSYLTARVGNSVMGDLRVRLFEHLQRMELAFFTRTKTGVIQSRLQNDVGGVASTLQSLITSVVGNTVTVIAAVVSMAVLSWQLTIVALVLMPLLVLVQRRVGQVRARIATATQESLSDMTAMTQEALGVSGILLAKSFGQERAEAARYRGANLRQIGLQVRQTMSGQGFFAVVSVVFSLVPIVVYVVSAYLITGGNPITAGTIVAFTTVQTRLTMPLLGLMRMALDVQTSKALFARIFEYLDLVPAIRDAPDARPVDDARLGEVEFDEVVFRYPDAEDDAVPTLDRVSFHVEPGQYVAFVGPSGAGKTTIAYLAARLYEVSGGAVRFAGDDVREIRHDSLVDAVGTVSQESYLFHASIADNLRYAKPGASDAELEAVCRRANIHETIASFPEGYATIVGERGYRLSGGEKQRIAIARVLLKDPAVLVLDEATSALDTLSERHVQRALDAASHGRTVLSIAHRLSTVRHADTIHVLDRGRIVESGTHEELIERGGLYATLHAEQHVEQELAVDGEEADHVEDPVAGREPTRAERTQPGATADEGRATRE
ncbi:ABC transporter ATP-binding protein [Pseudoclavibacter chungangensis]|uniref:ABC transporter ATP-binding protein n=1 Tax=Pseudoclavibacter chungangensis TaxID=587635 RepID=A0A7J5BZH0_9MICO|nr:ABC transporter ATP-binding protein [Pseudoclavibacter chungangensis]KAB1659709.1 ABC transporter ATP-binding protein [Pseudoclavibacter chungangensis]